MKKEFISFLTKYYDAVTERITRQESKIGSLTKENSFPHALNLFLQRSQQNTLEFLIIVFADPSEGFVILKKRDELAVCKISYVEYRVYSRKLKLLSLGGMSSVLMSTLLLSLFFSFILPHFRALAATYNWQQTDWAGGADACPGTPSDCPVDPTNLTNWTKYDVKDNTVTTALIAGKNVLTVTNDTNQYDTADTDFFLSGSSALYSEPNGASGTGASVRLDLPE